MKKGFYAIDTNCYYEREQPGLDTHIEVELKPSKYHIPVFVDGVFLWELDVSIYVSEINNKITIERDQRILSGFEYNGKQIACDNISQNNANAFLTVDSLGLLTFPVEWRTIDNSLIDIVDSIELKTFATTMMTYVKSVFKESWTIKDLIQNTTTIEEVNILYEAYINE